METQIELDLYFVRSQDGKWLRAKKHSVYGNFDTKGSWTDNIKDAKMYTKIGPARSQVTFWTKNYPDFGTPEIIHVTTGTYKVVNEGNRAKKAVLTAKINDCEFELRNAEYHLDLHLANVKKYKGDGTDDTTKSYKQKVASLKEKLEKLKEQKKNLKEEKEK